MLSFNRIRPIPPQKNLLDLFSSCKVDDVTISMWQEQGSGTQSFSWVGIRMQVYCCFLWILLPGILYGFSLW